MIGLTPEEFADCFEITGGGGSLSDELVEAVADLLLSIVESEDAKEA